jgi:hypothetical protein
MTQKKLKPIPAFLRDDAPFARSKTFQLIKDGVIKTVRIGKRQYVDMQAFEQLCTAGSEQKVRP